MRRFLFNCFVLSLLVYASSCAHVHTSVAVNVNDMGERVRTKYKYRVNSVCMGLLHFETSDFAKWQPDVFDANGVLVTFLEKQVVERCVEERRACGWPVMLPMLAAMSCCIVPMVETSHAHKTWPFCINGERGDIVSFEACVHADSAFGCAPLLWLLCWWNTDTCYSGKRTFDSHVMDAASSAFIDDEVQKCAMAYGLAVRLKELEDRGQIGDDMVVNGITTAELPAEIPVEVEIASCTNTTGGGFEYDFVLRSKGGGKLKLVDYGRIRSAFRVAIVNLYCMKHPEANPRSIATDFTRYEMSGDFVEGRVSVLTIEVTAVFYDAATRTGRMSARIAANQFEDVRRFIRNHIEELAARSNIVFDGDALPSGARFYTEDERLTSDGVLEVEFKTE